jgi:hypothetical protein
MTELYSILLSWAVTLSGYPAPPEQPIVELVSHQFFVERACSGMPSCKVLGWYAGGNTVYVDDRLDPQNNTYDSAIVVHEFVHFLQEHNNPRDKLSCKDTVQRELEAYAVQREYAVRYGDAFPIGVSMSDVHCEDK